MLGLLLIAFILVYVIHRASLRIIQSKTARADGDDWRFAAWKCQSGKRMEGPRIQFQSRPFFTCFRYSTKDCILPGRFWAVCLNAAPNPMHKYTRQYSLRSSLLHLDAILHNFLTHFYGTIFQCNCTQEWFIFKTKAAFRNRSVRLLSRASWKITTFWCFERIAWKRYIDVNYTYVNYNVIDAKLSCAISKSLCLFRSHCAYIHVIESVCA